MDKLKIVNAIIDVDDGYDYWYANDSVMNEIEYYAISNDMIWSIHDAKFVDNAPDELIMPIISSSLNGGYGGIEELISMLHLHSQKVPHFLMSMSEYGE